MRKKRDILALVLIFLYPMPAISQDSNLRERYNSYQNEKSDSLRIKKHLQYFYLLLGDNDKQKEAERELELIKMELGKFPIPSLNPRITYYEGILEYNRGEYIKSIISYELCLKSMPKITAKEIQATGNIYTSLGLSYSMVNDWENAQLNYQEAINETKKAKDSSGTALAYLNMAYIFSDVNDWVNASVNLKMSTNYLNTNSIKDYQIVIYASLAEAYARLDKIDESGIYLKKSDSLISLFPDARSNTFYFIAKGENAFSANNYSEAIAANFSSLNYARQWGDSAFVAKVLENIGRTYQALGKYSEAFSYLTFSNNIAKKYNYLPQRKETLKQLFLLYNKNGQFRKAVLAALELITISDSLAIVQNNNRRIILDAVFESENKEKRISVLEQQNELQQLRLNQKNTFNYILLGSAASLLTIFLLSFRSYKQKQKLQQQRINELETQHHLTATEAVLKGEEQERTRLAKDLHDGLGGLLSGIKYSLNTMKGNLIMTFENNQSFERSIDMLDSSIKEMRRIAHNMMPEALVKFGLDTALKDFCYDINQSGALQVSYQSIELENAVIEQTTAITIYRIVQELINNTMKHAAAKTAIVQVTKTNEEIAITVEDDGKGFDPVILKGAKGIGWGNILGRVEYMKGKLDIKSEPGKGTSVHIEIKS
jgi:signal transduction histidine kinase